MSLSRVHANNPRGRCNQFAIDGVNRELAERAAEGSVRGDLVPPVRIPAKFALPIHPGRLRCSSVT